MAFSDWTQLRNMLPNICLGTWQWQLTGYKVAISWAKYKKATWLELQPFWRVLQSMDLPFFFLLFLTQLFREWLLYFVADPGLDCILVGLLSLPRCTWVRWVEGGRAPSPSPTSWRRPWRRARSFSHSLPPWLPGIPTFCIDYFATLFRRTN